MEKFTLELTTKELQVIAKAIAVVHHVAKPCCRACREAEIDVLTKIEEVIDDRIDGKLKASLN